MFGFLNPVFLFAAASILIPIVLHMIQSRRTIKLPFSTIRFLKMAEENASRRIRMEHFLLWLLRTLLLLAIALAFAMPILRTRNFGGFLQRSQRDVAIVIDTSYSMRYATGTRTVWADALQSALSILDGLNPGDRVCVYAAAREARPVVKMLTEELELARASIESLEPGYSTSQLAPALMAANEVLQEDTRGREREIHVISDNQFLPWTAFGGGAAERAPDAGAADGEDGADRDDAGSAAPAAPDAATGSAPVAWDPARIDDRTVVFFTLVGVTAPENSAAVDVELSQALVMVNTPSRITARFTHSGSPRSSAVTLTLNDKELAQRSMVLDPAAPSAYTFSIPPLPPGVHAGRIELPPDNLPVDDTFHFLINVKDQLPSLCVGDAADTIFLMKALTITSPDTSAIDIRRIDAAELGEEPLTGYACLFLCNALPLPGQELLAIERYVKNGGLLVLFPGNAASATAYDAWTSLPAAPLAIEDVPLNRRKQMLRWTDAQHPLLRDITREAGVAPLVTLRRRLRFGPLAADARVIVSAGTEAPFLLGRPFGQGAVLLVNASADRSWSSFPLSPYFLPLVREIVQYGAFMGGFTPYLWTADRLVLSTILPGATRASRLQGPDRNDILLRSAVLDGETVLSAEGLTTPGLYTLEEESGRRQPAFAVNMPRRESDLTPLDPARIPEMTGLRDSYIAGSADELAQHIEEHRIGRTLGEPLLWLALILAAMECAYANRLSQQSPKLSEALGIDTSGKVKG